MLSGSGPRVRLFPSFFPGGGDLRLPETLVCLDDGNVDLAERQLARDLRSVVDDRPVLLRHPLPEAVRPVRVEERVA